METEQKFQIVWEKLENRKACILKVYAASNSILLPSQLNGYTVTEIAPYCFSSVSKLQAQNQYELYTTLNTKLEEVTEFSGAYIEKIELPLEIEKIGKSAFYNCRNLKEISIGERVKELGTDVFMNCIRLKKIIIRANPFERTALKLILDQLSSDINVEFIEDNKIVAKLLYPEYYEAYDEVAAAHIFARKISGEGFRARQGFKDGIVDFTLYDTIFPQACVEEKEWTLATMALNRLIYPVSLTQEASALYQRYIKNHPKEIVNHLIEQKKLFQLTFLCKKNYISRQELMEAIEYASKQNWAEGTATLLRLKSKYYYEKQVRYDFDMF